MTRKPVTVGDWETLLNELMALAEEIDTAKAMAQLGRNMANGQHVVKTKRDRRVFENLPQVYEDVFVRVLAAVEVFKEDTGLEDI
jgi:hypothetical protein